MTTPTFRDWAVMFGKCIQGHGPRELERSKPLARYILSRIERKEKALRDSMIGMRTAEEYSSLCNDLTIMEGRESEWDAERSRIAERVRRLGWKEAHALADDIKEGKV